MRREQMEPLCRAAEGGETKFVEHLKWRYTGRVIGCDSEKVIVDAFGRRFKWPSGLCRETRGDVERLGPPSDR